MNDAVFTIPAHGADTDTILREAGQLLGRAFFGDPWASKVQPDPARRARGLAGLYTPCLRHAIHQGGVWLDSRRRAVLAWLPLTSLPCGPRALVRYGYLYAPWHIGLRATLTRLLPHEHWCNHRVEALAGGAPHRVAYLYALGVEPSCAGQGLGGTLIEQAVRTSMGRFDRFLLRTEQPRNVRFYERHGFKCVEQSSSPLGTQVWFFSRELASERGLPEGRATMGACAPGAGRRQSP